MKIGKVQYKSRNVLLTKRTLKHRLPRVIDKIKWVSSTKSEGVTMQRLFLEKNIINE